MILEFFQKIIKQISRQMEEKELLLNKSLQLNISLYNKINNAKGMLKKNELFKKGKIKINEDSLL